MEDKPRDIARVKKCLYYRDTKEWDAKESQTHRISDKVEATCHAAQPPGRCGQPLMLMLILLP